MSFNYLAAFFFTSKNTIPLTAIADDVYRMKKILYLLTLLTFSITYAQNQASNWYFGENAGIQFNTSTGNTTALTDGLLHTDEGCTSISDDDGNLLFYTDGITVYDRNHNIMPNGNFLKGNPSSTQSAIIIPKPNDPNIYFIFTVDTESQFSPDEGFHFSEIDITLNAGLGDVTSNKNIPLLGNTSEKLSAVLKDCESGNIWVITFADNFGGSNHNTFYAYEVSDTGVNLTPVTSNAGVTINERRGYLKFSPDGTKLVSANINEGLFLYDFDLTTGTVSAPKQITINPAGLNGAIYSYGIEFSPNSQVLYVSAYNDFFSNSNQQNNNPANHKSAILQYDLSDNNIVAINASQTTIDARQGFRSALQLGPNGKIYKTESSTYDLGIPFLSTIESPNTLGQGCDFITNSVNLNGRNARQGLPPFISSFFTQKIDITGNATETSYLPLCNGDVFTLFADNIPGATYTWYKDGVLLSETSYELEISEDGTYELTIDLDSTDCETLEGEAIVEYFENPNANTAQDIIICDDNNDNTWSFDFTSQDSDIIGTQDATAYSVHYFTSFEDAENNTTANEITGPFSNTENPQTIYARIHHINNPNCYDITTFDIEVFHTPIANPVDNFITCDDAADGDDTNGQIDVVLTDFNAAILGTQNAADYNITYHNSQAFADTGSPILTDTYYTQTPNTETIYVRIENKLNTSCFSTTSFDIIVNPLPNRFPSNIFQCDEDGIVDGITIFNLTEAEGALSGGAANVSFNYYTELIDAQNEENAIDGTSFSNISNPQTVYVQIIDDASNCSAITELTLEVSTTQIQNYVAPAVCDELNSEDGINTYNLNEITSAIQTINNITLPITYYESYTEALLEQNPLTSPYTNTSPYTQVIYARAEDNNACYGISQVSLTTNKRPELKEDETLLYCLNAYPETITLTSGVIGDPNNYTYVWSTGETTSEIEINQVGNYTVEVSSAAGCPTERTITIEASNTATIDAIDVIDGAQNNIVTVSASGEGIYEYALLDFDGNMYRYYQTSNVFENVYPGIYTVAVKDVKNDCGIAYQLTSVVGFPKFFTPNNDGYHDTWQVLGISNQFQPNSKIKIFDRYGKLLKELDPLGEGWDGTFNGRDLPSGDYWFSVLLQDDREYFNHFSLKR